MAVVAISQIDKSFAGDFESRRNGVRFCCRGQPKNDCSADGGRLRAEPVPTGFLIQIKHPTDQGPKTLLGFLGDRADVGTGPNDISRGK